MEQFIYRSIEKKDYKEVGELLNQAFGLHRYVTDKKALECFKMQYVYSCLSEAVYTCVAEKNGKVVGVIMGNAKKDYHILRHVPYITVAGRYRLKMKYYGRKCKNGIEDYHHLHKIYGTFLKRHIGEFDGVLTLFAVDETCRGSGVGKKILSDFLKYLKEQKVNRIYLYTDTTCSYGFYEHYGFERLEEQPMTMTRDGKTFQMRVFLYGYTPDS